MELKITGEHIPWSQNMTSGKITQSKPIQNTSSAYKNELRT